MIEYGITTSQADYWVHVCPIAPPRTEPAPGGHQPYAFYYRRQRMLNEISSGTYTLTDSFSGGIQPTGRGYLVPIDLPFVARWLILPGSLFSTVHWSLLSDQDAGLAAQRLVLDAVQMGRWPVAHNADELTNKADQYQGKDIRIWPAKEWTIEVKLDRPALKTGKLFVQTHELRHNVSHVRSA